MHEVPVERASSVDDIQRADQIFLDRTVLFHHAIVESVDKRNGEVNIIEYTNTATEFIRDNFCHPKNPGKAEVVRGKIKFDTNEHVYVIKHTRCFDPDTVVSRAESQLGKREYNACTNNCEHFALWCKTGISSSDQVNTIKDAVKVVATSVLAEKGTEEIVKTSCEVFCSTTTMIPGFPLLLKETTEIIAGQEVVKTVIAPVVGPVPLGTTSNIEEAFNRLAALMKPGGIPQIAPKETVTKLPSVVSHSVSSTGQGVVTTVSTQTEYVSKVRDCIFETTTRKRVTEKVVTETTSQGRQQSTAAGLKCAMALEVLSAGYDISCVYKDKQEGKISQEEFQTAVANRVVTGTMNVAGTTLGAAIGQVLFPIPWVGGFMGGKVGSSLGKKFGGWLFS